MKRAVDPVDRCPRQQSEIDRCDVSARRALRRDRRQRLGQEHAGRGDALPRAAASNRSATPTRAAPYAELGRQRRSRRCRLPRPVAAVAVGAVEPGHAPEGVRRDPQDVRRDSRGEAAELRRRPVQLQRRGGPLQRLPGEWLSDDRHAVPPRRDDPLSGVSRARAIGRRSWRSPTAARTSPRCST